MRAIVRPRSGEGNLLSVRKLPHEAKVYAGVGHMFSRDGKETQWGSFLSAKQLTDAFLDKRFKPESVAQVSK